MDGGDKHLKKVWQKFGKQFFHYKTR